MGIKLDWQIEAERAYQKAGEDPAERRRRRVQRTRILMFTLGVAIVFAIGVGAVWLRLYTVDNKLRQDLINTVQAETATVRLDDFAGFIAIQRTAPGGNWYQDQIARFNRYQDLKTKSNLKLTGNVVDATVDGSRGRAVIEEDLDGVPYHTVWFYWRYSDGWRHVPSDYTFWGVPETIHGKVSTVQYSDLDDALAKALAPQVDQWWADGCSYLGCGATQKLTLQIISEPLGDARWDQQQANTLILPSPLAMADRTRADQAVPPDVVNKLAVTIAEHIFDDATANLQPNQTADAAWLRQQTVDWLTMLFTGQGDINSVSFIQSIKDHYGATSLAALMHSLKADSDIGIVSQALQQPLESLALDWRSFFQWRLNVEKTLLTRNDISNFQALWDTQNPTAFANMQQRMSHPTEATAQVQSVAITVGTDGAPLANVQATLDDKPLTITFRLVNGGWKRST